MYAIGPEEDQFPPGSGNRGGVKGTAVNTYQRGYKTLAVANVAEQASEVFVFMTMDDTHLKVTTPPPVEHTPSHDTPSTSSNPHRAQIEGGWR